MDQEQLDLFGQTPNEDPPTVINEDSGDTEITDSDPHNRSPTEINMESPKEKGPAARRLLSAKELREMSYQLKFKSPPPEPEQ
jgi:hypothetical protein